MKNILTLIVLALVFVSCSSDNNEELIIESEVTQRESLEASRRCKPRYNNRCNNKVVLNIPMDSNSFRYVAQECDTKVTIFGEIVEKLEEYPISVSFNLPFLKKRFVLENRANETSIIKISDGKNEPGVVVKGKTIYVQPGYKAILRKNKQGELNVRYKKLK